MPGLAPLEILRMLAMSSGHALGGAAGYAFNPLRPGAGEMQMPPMYMISPQDKLRYMASLTPLQEEGKLSESRQMEKRATKQKPAPEKIKEEDQ